MALNMWTYVMATEATTTQPHSIFVLDHETRMGISSVAVILMMVGFLYIGFSSASQVATQPKLPEFPPPLSVGKSRNLQASSQDAGMYIQDLRRQTIIQAGRLNNQSFTNGVVEFALTAN